jgi:hypothetical protein
MGHTAGLSGFDPAIAPEDLYDHDRRCRAPPGSRRPLWWEPGTLSGLSRASPRVSPGGEASSAGSPAESIGAFFRRPRRRTARRRLPHRAPRVGGADRVGRPGSRRRPAILGAPSRLGERSIDADSIAVRTLLSCPLTGRETGDPCVARAPRSPPPVVPATLARSPDGPLGRWPAVAHRRRRPPHERRGCRTRARTAEPTDVDLVLGTNMRLGTGFGLMNDTVPLSPNPREPASGAAGAARSRSDRPRRAA